VRTCDLFLTHAWRFHADWKRLVDLLNAHDVRAWRNFSLPWYDPALDPRTEAGGKAVRWHLETQIIPVQAVILLCSLLSEPGTQKWLDFELEAARKHGKPILALPAWGETNIPDEVRGLVDQVVSWDAPSLLEAVKTHVSRTQTGEATHGDGQGSPHVAAS
jgi:hypothetical protein